MADIFEEVDENIRKDKATEAWEKYGMFVWGLAAVLVAGVAFLEFMKWQNAQTAEERMLSFEEAVQALQDGEYAKAETDLQALVDEKTSLSPLAAHYLAQTKLTGMGDADAAGNILSSVSDANGNPFEKLALLKSAYYKADALSLSELESLLGALKDDEGPVGAMAQELIAAKVYESGDVPRARTLYNRLKFDPAAPEGVRVRSELALAAIPVEAIPDPVAPPVPETQPEVQPETPVDSNTEETSP